jgi:hypothetical protein
MGQFLQVNGDYNIKTAEGASIIFDTGPILSGGNVRVIGDLIVEGSTVSVETTNLDLTDNIITLNSGETREGVTLDYSGIEIDRGFYADSSQVPRAVFIYSEPDDLVNLEETDPRPTWIIANNSAPGPFNFDESNLTLRRILTNPTTDDGDLILIGSGTGVIKVFGTEAYENQVTHDDDIPNKKYVDDRILSNPTFQIVAPQDQDTKVIITDKDILPNDPTESGSLAYFEDVTNETTNGESAVSVIVDTTLVAQFYSNRLEIGNLEIGSGIRKNQITSKSSVSGDNIYIKTLGGGRLQTNAAIQLEKIASAGSFVPDSVLVYANTPSAGESGVWFLNDNADITKRNGELISKSKALVFSMLF